MNNHRYDTSRGSPVDRVPTLTMGIDLDQRWGVRGLLGQRPHPIDDEIRRMPELVHRMMFLLADVQFPVTWMIPGALACSSWDEYFDIAPDDPVDLPSRHRITLVDRDFDPSGGLHFFPTMVEEIARTEAQQIGTLGFSALDLGAPGVTAADAVAEVTAAIQLLGHSYSAAVVSCAFPRGNVAFLDELREATPIERYVMPLGTVEPPVGATDVPHRRRLLGALSPARAVGYPPGVDTVVVTHDVDLGLGPRQWERVARRLAADLRTAAHGRNLHIRLTTRPRDFTVGRSERLRRFEHVVELAEAAAAADRILPVQLHDLRPPWRDSRGSVRASEGLRDAAGAA
mgnify:CR=1 FL=1